MGGHTPPTQPRWLWSVSTPPVVRGGLTGGLRRVGFAHRDELRGTLKTTQPSSFGALAPLLPPPALGRSGGRVRACRVSVRKDAKKQAVYTSRRPMRALSQRRWRWRVAAQPHKQRQHPSAAAARCVAEPRSPISGGRRAGAMSSGARRSSWPAPSASTSSQRRLARRSCPCCPAAGGCAEQAVRDAWRPVLASCLASRSATAAALKPGGAICHSNAIAHSNAGGAM